MSRARGRGASADAAAKPGPGPAGSRRTRWAVALVASGVLLALAIVLIVLGVLGYLTHNKALKGPRVKLDYATYVGTKISDNIVRYRGIRYAAPPVGDLRWRAPADPEANQGVVSAKKFGPVCLGTSYSYPTDGQDEDCLFLNVWAPANATEGSKLPVWLFIQGGGYAADANANWDGAEVVAQSGHGVVFVNFNYRVGMWGFLAGERVRADGALNAGLLDQRAVLRWVQRHIALFGGDPARVVLHGVSAGAGSVALHMAAYGGRDDGLFAAAAAESVFLPAQPRVGELEWQLARLVDAAGCGGRAEADQLACLRGRDAATLQAANAPSPFPNRTASPLPLFYWTPCVDGDLIRDVPYRMFEAGNFIRVPALFGNDNDEGTAFAVNAATSGDVANFMANNYPKLTPNDTAAVVARYPLMPPLPNHNPWFPSAAAAYGETTFICPSVNILDAYYGFATTTNNNSGGNGSGAAGAAAAAPPPLWSYRYNVRDDDNAAAGLGVPHVFESAAVFGPDSLPGGQAARSYYSYNAPMVPLVMAYFVSFVRALDPNPFRAEGAPEWGRWAAGGGGNSSSSSSGGDGGAGHSRSRLLFELNDTRMEEVPAAQVARCEFWKGLADKIEQ